MFVTAGHMGWDDALSRNEVTIRNAKTINNHKLRNYTLSLVNSDAEQ